MKGTTIKILPVALALIMLFTLLSVSAKAQPAMPHGITVENPEPYEYDGWKHKTRLKGNWSGDTPPGVNDRLYEYDETNTKTGTYYEHNGYEWKEKGNVNPNAGGGGDAYELEY